MPSSLEKLPDHFKSELYLSGTGRGGGDLSAIASELRSQRSPIAIEDGKILGRRRKVSAVQDIEDLDTELSIEGFRDPPDLVVLKDREVEVYKPGADQPVAAEVPHKIQARVPVARRVYAVRCNIRRRSRDGETFSLNVVHLPGVDQRLTVRGGQNTRDIEGRVCAIQAKRITAKAHGKWSAAARLENCAKLVAINKITPQSRE